MKQYHKLLKEIKFHGTLKPAAREGMPSTTSLFGYQFRHDLSIGFPILTTKKISFKAIIVELLWFLRGDTNIKYLIDNGCNIWNEDAYNYYKKIASKNLGKEANGIYHNNGDSTLRMFLFDEFVSIIKNEPERLEMAQYDNYTLGDCGKQYGWLWRKWTSYHEEDYGLKSIDQIKILIEGLKKNPESRRHIITAWNPSTLDEMALNACHAMVQFNCRPVEIDHPLEEDKDEYNLPKYYLDCQLYQRSADVFLGVPYNVSSYALLTYILCKICNMLPGHFIHSFGDVHIYENHQDQVDEILERDVDKYKLPTLVMQDTVHYSIDAYKEGHFTLDKMIKEWTPEMFKLEGYESYPSIKAPLSTGLK